jgi:hypothetical protein
MNDAVLVEREALRHVKPTYLASIQHLKEGAAPTTDLPRRALVLRNSSRNRDMTQF